MLHSLGWLWAFNRWTYFDHFNQRRDGQLTHRRTRNGGWFFCSIYTKVSEDKTIYDIFRVLRLFYRHLSCKLSIIMELNWGYYCKKRLKFHVEREIKLQSKQISLVLAIYFLKQNEFKNLFAYGELMPISPVVIM